MRIKLFVIEGYAIELSKVKYVVYYAKLSAGVAQPKPELTHMFACSQPRTQFAMISSSGEQHGHKYPYPMQIGDRDNNVDDDYDINIEHRMAVRVRRSEQTNAIHPTNHSEE